MGSDREIRKGEPMATVINDVIEMLTTTVEKVHQDIAHKPLEVVELIAPNLAITKTVADVQAKIIGGVYDVIRGANKAVAELVGGTLTAGKKVATPPEAKPA
jgi:hypothetical protein